jgi:PIN domain nuclease of toxin-antitoxin system
MRVLLDTHTFLWFIEGEPLLSTSARQAIEDIANERLLSIASVWEIAIKISIGKLTLRDPLPSIIPRQLYDNDISLLNVSLAHVMRITNLPLHHRDPFDRLLIAQAIEEDLRLISVDAGFDSYGVTRLW